MSLSGRYKAENNDDYLSHYYIVMDVKETDKSYIFTLVELESRYSASHMQHLFLRSKRRGLLCKRTQKPFFSEERGISCICYCKSAKAKMNSFLAHTSNGVALAHLRRRPKEQERRRLQTATELKLPS